VKRGFAKQNRPENRFNPTPAGQLKAGPDLTGARIVRNPQRLD